MQIYVFLRFVQIFSLNENEFNKHIDYYCSPVRLPRIGQCTGRSDSDFLDLCF